MSHKWLLVRIVAAAVIGLTAGSQFGGPAVLSAAPAEDDPPKRAEREAAPPKTRRPERSLYPQPGPAEQAILDALASPTELQFIETPLQDIVDYLRDKHKIELQIDRSAMDDVGIGSDTPITKNLRGISLRSALNLMLRELDLTWTIRDETLLITTPEAEESTLTTRTYDVADLVVYRDEKGQLVDDYDGLLGVVTTSVHPNTWDAAGGPGSLAGDSFGSAKVLVVSQTRRGHERVVELLKQIRQVAANYPDTEPPLLRRSPVGAPMGAAGTGNQGAGNQAIGGGMGGGGEGFF